MPSGTRRKNQTSGQNAPYPGTDRVPYRAPDAATGGQMNGYGAFDPRQSRYAPDRRSYGGGYYGTPAGGNGTERPYPNDQPYTDQPYRDLPYPDRPGAYNTPTYRSDGYGADAYRPPQNRGSNGYNQINNKKNQHGNTGRPGPKGDRRKTEKPPRRSLRAWLIAAAVLLVAVGVFVVVNSINTNNMQKAAQALADSVRPYDDKFCEGVYVNGLHLGGMTADQAYAAVQTVVQQQTGVWRVRLLLNGSAVAEITADMLGLGPDSPQVYNAIASTLNDAWMQGHTGTVAQRKSSMDTLRNNPYMANVQLPAADTSVIEPILRQIQAQVETPATDASVIAFDPNQATPFTYNPERNGLTLDIAPLERQLYDMVSNQQAGDVVITPAVIEPNVKVEDLKKDHMLLSSVSTDISTTSAENRNQNIRRAMELINGTIIQPGQQFSFNDVVGERTTKNGFLPAIEYAYNEHVEGIGGGVCQASSTLYQAAVKSGLQIIKRSPHSDSVSYAEYGKDATVYWVGKRKIDLVFKNNTDKPIYIVAAVQNAPNSKKRLVTKVSIYGRDPGDVRYDLETNTIEMLSIPDPEIKKDTEGTYAVYDDEMVQATDGKLGYVVESYQVQYTGKYETDRKLLYTDTYKPQAPTVYVGIQKRVYV